MRAWHVVAVAVHVGARRLCSLGEHWEVVVDQAEKSGRDEPDRKDWRVLSIIYLADTREQAIDDCTYGLQDFANYFGAAGFVPLANAVEGTQSPREFVEEYAGKGNCCIGTPGDAIAYIQDLLGQSGGFGTLLLLGHDGRRHRRRTTPTNCSPAR